MQLEIKEEDNLKKIIYCLSTCAELKNTQKSVPYM